MDTSTVQQDIADALALIERANAKLRPGELSRPEARSLIHAYGRIVKLGGFGVAPYRQVSGTPLRSRVFQARRWGRPVKRWPPAPPSRLRPISTQPCSRGTVSLDQAAEIARAEEAAPGSARTLVKAAQRLARASKAGNTEDAGKPFERHLADAYAQLLGGGAGKGRAKRPELTVLISHSVAKRGWKDVKPGEMCKIPGIGPTAPRIEKEIASICF